MLINVAQVTTGYINTTSLNGLNVLQVIHNLTYSMLVAINPCQLVILFVLL